MGLLDFIFGNKKKEQERLRLEEEAHQKALEIEQVKREEELREQERRKKWFEENQKNAEERKAKTDALREKLKEVSPEVEAWKKAKADEEESRRKEQERQARLRAEREQAESIQPFTFKSNCHQRYENGTPVKGLQECLRTVSVVKNTDGCPGYKLQPGIGYIVRIYNDDLGKPNMSDKPMGVVRKTDTSIELRGFPIEAQSPFGWQEVDYRDYGFVVYHKNGQVEKCVLHMYDRNVRIEYMKRENLSQKETIVESSSNPSAKVNSTKTTETELLVQEALSHLSAGNDGDAVYHPLYKAWRSFQQNPEQLKHIKDFGKYGMGLMIFLSYGTVSDIDDHQQIASVSYLFLSKAIHNSQQNVNLYKNRLILMISNHEAFEYTVSSVVNKGEGFMFMNLTPFKARDAMFKMEFADLLRGPQLLSIDMLAQRYMDLQNKISNGFFGPNQDNASIRDKGNALHQEILDYLEDKVINESDIDF